jgi:hypothetical protein
MGLDMYMYKIEKLTEEEAAVLDGLAIRDIETKYRCIDKLAFDSNPDKYGDLIPFIREIHAIDSIFDEAACFKAHGINYYHDEVCGGYQDYDTISWIFSSGSKVEIDRAEYDSYCHEQEIVVYVFKSKNVAYWRKFYELDDFLQRERIVYRTNRIIQEEGRSPTDGEIMSWRTENCGYYMLSVEEKYALSQYLETNIGEHEDQYHFSWDSLLHDENSVLMYLAWW